MLMIYFRSKVHRKKKKFQKEKNFNAITNIIRYYNKINSSFNEIYI